MNKLILFSLNIVFFQFFLITNSHAQNVALDPSFNIGTSFNNSVISISQQSDGKLMVAGLFTSYNGTTVNYLARLNTNGTLDPNFSLTPNLISGFPSKVKVLANGKIMTTGLFKFVPLKNGGQGTGALLVFNNDGSLYSGFNTNPGDGIPEAKNFDIDPNGKIIVVGGFRFMYDDSIVIDIPDGVMRLNADGSRDQVFQSGAGIGVENLISGGVSLAGAEALENGKYLLYGNFQRFNGRNAAYFVRLNSNGSLDTTFNSSGSGFNGTVSDAIELPDGKYLVAGIFTSYNGTNVKKIARLFPNGILDTTFKNTLDFNVINDILRKPDGKILVGYDVVGGGGGYPNGILQLNENGSYDNTLTFGSGIYTYGQFVNTLCLQSDNNIVIGGAFSGGFNGTSSPRIARLLPCGSGRRDTVYACNSYLWNNLSYTLTGTYTQTINSTNGCSRVDTLQLFINSGIPASPTITQTLVSNLCGARVYRYTASVVTNGVGYSWNLPSSVGGVSGITVDSGNILTSRVIKVRYASNEAAIAGDSIRVKAFSGCGQSAIRSVKLINTKLNVPTAPASVTITPIQTNVCGARIYRYAAPNLPAATTTAAAATGYIWDFVGTLRLSGLTIDSGSLTSQKLVVRFASNLAAATGDSVRVCYTSACGNSLRKASKLSNTNLNPPLAPASITIQALGATSCGQPRYRYTAPSLIVATTTSGAATGYEWSFYGQWTLGQNAVIDSGSLTARVLVIRYLNGNVKQAGDTVKCRYNSNCGFSAYRAISLNNTAIGNNPPLKPASITIAIKDTTICGRGKYRYVAPVLPLANATNTAATGYVWTLPTTDIGAVLDSGTLNSKSIVVRYTNNRAALAGDSMYLQYSSACGSSPIKAQRLTNLAKLNCRTTDNIQKSWFVKHPDIMGSSVFPNPSSGGFNLIFDKPLVNPVQLSVFDSQGRCIEFIRNITLSTVNGIGEKYKTGIYFLEVFDGNKIVGTHKLVKL